MLELYSCGGMEIWEGKIRCSNLAGNDEQAICCACSSSRYLGGWGLT